MKRFAPMLVPILMCGSLAGVLLPAPALLAQADPTFGDDPIEVTVGRPFTILPSPDDYPYDRSRQNFDFVSLQQIRGGRLFAKVWAARDAALPEEAVNLLAVWTDDGGQTWGRPVRFHGKQAGGHSFLCRKDGTCIWLGYFLRPVDPNDKKTLRLNVGRSSDGRDFTWSAGTVCFPRPVKDWTQGNAYMVCSRSILEGEDGALLATVYGEFAGDKCNRSGLIRSTDGGATWDYYSTIAHDATGSTGHRNEPVLVRLGDGELLCVMRNRSNQPMYVARSRDNGRTFGPARRLPGYAASVFPDMVEMACGLVAVSFGRPGNHIMFSVDGGRRWTKRTTIHAGTASDGYTALREIEPGRLLYAYHEAVPLGDGRERSLIRGVLIEVRRK